MAHPFITDAQASQKIQESYNDIVNSIGTGFQGAITIADTPTEAGVYIPTEAGVYPNAGGLEYAPEGDDKGHLVQFIYDGTNWVKSRVEVTLETLDLVNNIESNDTDNAVSGKAVAEYAMSEKEYIYKKNLAEISGLKKGKVNEEGYVNDSNNWIHSEIKLEENKTYTISGNKPVIEGTTFVAFYSSETPLEANLISYTSNNANTFTTPAGTKSVIINVANVIDIGLTPQDNEYVNTFQVEEGSEATEFTRRKIIKEEFLDIDGLLKREEILIVKNIVKLEDFSEGSVNIYGDKNSSTNWLSVNVNVNENTEYTISGRKLITSSSPTGFFYNSTTISESSKIDVIPNNLQTEQTILTPAGCVMMVLNIANVIDIGLTPQDNEYVNTFQVEEGSEATEFTRGEVIKKELLPASYASTKKSGDNEIIVSFNSTESIAVYAQNRGDRYIKFVFERSENEGKFYNIWKLNWAYISKRVNDSFTFNDLETIVRNGVWENALQTNGAGYTDFLGSIHGHEITTDISFIGNGLFLDINSLIGQTISFSDLVIVHRSEFTESDGISIIGASYKTTEFFKDKLKTTNRIEWKGSLEFTNSTFVAMCPVLRKTISGTGVNVTSFATRNDEWIKYDVSNDNFSNALIDEKINKADRVIIGGDDFSLDMEVSASPKLDNRGFWVQNTERYNKLYYQLGATTVNDGDEWNINTIYRFNIGDV